MITITLLMTLLSPVSAQIQTCQWPNKCAVKPVRVAQVQPCVWPKTCAAKPVVRVAKASGPITTCDYPNKCS